MGLDLSFLNVKMKVENLNTYWDKTRLQVFKKLNKNYDEFYKFEESIKGKLGDDWNIVHAMNVAITTKKIDGIDTSSEFDCKILTKKDLEETIEFLKQDNIATKVLGDSKLIDIDSGLPIDVEKRYPKEYWNQIRFELEKILELVDFENNTLIMKYSY